MSEYYDSDVERVLRLQKEVAQLRADLKVALARIDYVLEVSTRGFTESEWPSLKKIDAVAKDSTHAEK